MLFVQSIQARFGQNDYIDLLGDGSVHPAQLLSHVPAWLRGFPGQHKANELVKLIHYRNLYKTQLQVRSNVLSKDEFPSLRRILHELGLNSASESTFC